MSPEAIATREAPAELKFQGQLAGEPKFLLVHDCEVYRVDQTDNGGVQWTSVLAPDFYPMWTACQRQSMSFNSGELTVTLGRMALGAGGLLRHRRHLSIQRWADVEEGVICKPKTLRRKGAR